jgi:hypothetical protein
MARKKTMKEKQMAKIKSAKKKSAKTRRVSREQVKKRMDILDAGTAERTLNELASRVDALSERHQAVLRKHRNHCLLGNDIFACVTELFILR